MNYNGVYCDPWVSRLTIVPPCQWLVFDHHLLSSVQQLYSYSRYVIFNNTPMVRTIKPILSSATPPPPPYSLSIISLVCPLSQGEDS